MKFHETSKGKPWKKCEERGKGPRWDRGGGEKRVGGGVCRGKKLKRRLKKRKNPRKENPCNPQHPPSVRERELLLLKIFGGGVKTAIPTPLVIGVRWGGRPDTNKGEGTTKEEAGEKNI